MTATAAVIGGMLLSDCGGSAKNQPSEAPANTDPIAYSLRQYRDDVYFHRRARVAMNTCVAWSNVSGGITVVENPGVSVEPLTSPEDRSHAFFVFDYPDTDGKPPLLQQMNGPQTYVDDKNRVFGGGPSGTILSLELDKSKSYFAYVTERALGRKPMHANNGQVYYSDKQTGEPVMNTVFTNGPFNSDHVNKVCDQLRQGRAVNPPLPK